jgi:putative mRNA 3-end processing factor
MAKTVAEAVLGYPNYLKDAQKLRKVLSKVFWVRSDKDRKKAAEKFPIIVTTAGMATGGPIVYYLRELKGEAEAKVIFVGYLAEDSPARILMDTGFFRTAEEQFKVRCDIRQFDFSAHAGRTELFDMIKMLKPKKLFAVHGDSCRKFADDVGDKFGIEAFAPENGDAIAI